MTTISTVRRTFSRRRSATTTALLSALAAAATALALLPAAPATAGTLAKAGPNWVIAQQVRGTTTAVKVQWPRVARARYYEIDYVASRDGRALTGRQIQGSSRTRTVRARATSAGVQNGVVPGLTPGAVYCFQVRARAGRVAGLRGAPHCKQTTRANRARTASTVPLVVGTFNVCSAACSTMAPWSTRRTEVVRRIRAMNVGRTGRAVDVLAVQEGANAVRDGGYLDQALAGTFEKACTSPRQLQALYVRSSTYTVVRGTRGSLAFDSFNDPSHGACWVRLAERSTGREIVVMSLHLEFRPTLAAVRGRETAAAIAAATADNPGHQIVLAGDFNSSRSHASDAPRTTLARLGYDDAYDQALSYLSLPYRNSACGTNGAIRKSWTWGDHIDRVFVPAGVAARTWEVDYRLRSSSRYASPMASDHNPVVVELRLPV